MAPKEFLTIENFKKIVNVFLTFQEDVKKKNFTTDQINFTEVFKTMHNIISIPGAKSKSLEYLNSEVVKTLNADVLTSKKILNKKQSNTVDDTEEFTNKPINQSVVKREIDIEDGLERMISMRNDDKQQQPITDTSHDIKIEDINKVWMIHINY